MEVRDEIVGMLVLSLHLALEDLRECWVSHDARHTDLRNSIACAESTLAVCAQNGLTPEGAFAIPSTARRLFGVDCD